MWGAARSDFSALQSLWAGSCLLRHARVKTQAVLWIMPELTPGRIKLTSVLILPQNPQFAIITLLPASEKCSQSVSAQRTTGNPSGYRKSEDAERREDQVYWASMQSLQTGHVPVPEDKQHPEHLHGLSTGPPCAGAADKQPGNHFVPGKAEMSTKNKV